MAANEPSGKWTAVPQSTTGHVYSTINTTSGGYFGGTWDSSFIGAVDPAYFSNTYTVDPSSALRGEVDNLRMRLEELIALVEKLEIEARYWHAKAKILENS